MILSVCQWMSMECALIVYEINTVYLTACQKGFIWLIVKLYMEMIEIVNLNQYWPFPTRNYICRS